jgi:hypothetical protein
MTMRSRITGVVGLLRAAAVLLLSWLLTGCSGAAARHGETTGHTPEGTVTATANVSTVAHGRDTSEAGKIAVLVARYYAAAARDDGALAYSMIYSMFEEAIAEDYGQPPGPTYLRGKTCAVVMSKLFKHVPRQPPSVLAHTEITGVHVEGGRGYVQLKSSGMPRGEIPVEREHRAWKVQSLIGTACTSCAGAGTVSVHIATGANDAPPWPGSETPEVNTPATYSGPPRRDSNDGDGDLGTYDDNPVLDYGRPADSSDRLAIVQLVRRYYQAAATENGSAACSLLYSLVAESLAEQSGASARYAARTCAGAVSATFTQAHTRLTADATAFKVTGVRVDGPLAYVLLSFGSHPGPYTIVHRDGVTWKVEYLLDD